ncbi:GntR family transcriptional regulator [Streptomyces morookaense]|uniref:GntR family transcriptional regulator n=1 Tax=Streptomyces morookaense TaxID=1970 RepID=A0A7Y7EAX3_STRMO|nr:GntR family transcriptional regulator [Streptomyces morookaense]NVK81959.1 GntR family transcriptional regulator [Streptomyces morookaense]GHF39386.1 GntR family transcriptional regulator [Streptomyces morookaense]
MLIRLDHGSSVPLGDQIAAAVRGAIADGSVRPGDRLPAARTLADSLGVNIHTVLRGYQRLRTEGLIELRRGRGAVVTDSGDEASRGRARLVEGVRHLVVDARALGLTDEEVIDLVRTGLSRT